MADSSPLQLYVSIIPVLLSLSFVPLIVTVLSALTVFAQDVSHFVSVIIMLGFYATPIVYQASMLPEKFQIFLKINPMAQLVEAYRSILYYHQMPDMFMLTVWGIGSIIVLVLGYLIFKKLERSFVEEL